MLFKLCFGYFKIFLRLNSLSTIFAPQKPPKNHHRSLKEMQRLPKLLVLLKINVEGFGKIFRYTICITFANISKIIFSFDSVFAPKAPKHRDRAHKWVWHRLNTIMSFRKFRAKLLANLCFENFWIFLKFCLLFQIFDPKIHTKNHHRSLKKVWHQINLLSMFETHVKFFGKLCI